LTIPLADAIQISINTVADGLPYVAVYISSEHNPKFSIHSLPKKEYG